MRPMHQQSTLESPPLKKNWPKPYHAEGELNNGIRTDPIKVEPYEFKPSDEVQASKNE